MDNPLDPVIEPAEKVEKAVEKKVRTFWHFLYNRRRKRFLNKTSGEILAGQIVSLAGSIAAGLLLNHYKQSLIAVTGAFFLLPGIFELGGSVAGAYAAKINHSLCEDKTCDLIGKHNPFGRSIFQAFAVILTASFILGGVGGILGYLLFKADVSQLIFITVSSAAMIGFVGLPLIGLLTVLIFKLGNDPDNFIGPFETSLFDALTVVAVALTLGYLS